MNEGYLRQRRNLISISIFILLAIIGGTTTNPLFPFQLERPEVAQLFMWIGFGYFWYRVKIYTPGPLFELFRNEVILTQIKIHKYSQYSEYNLGSFSGSIIVDATHTNDSQTEFNFIGIADSTGQGTPDSIFVPLNIGDITNKKNYLRNLASGKVITEYFLPQIIAIVTLLVGTYKHRILPTDAYIDLAPVLLVFGALYITVSDIKS